MTIRLRLILAIVGTALALAPVILWQTARMDRQAIEDSIHSLALATMNDWGLEACRDWPESFAGGSAWFESRGPFGGPFRGGRPRSRPEHDDDRDARGQNGDGPGGSGPPPPHDHGDEPRRPPDEDDRAGDGDQRPGRPLRAFAQRARERFAPSPDRILGPTESRFDYKLWAYRSDYHSDNPNAPEIPSRLRLQLENGAAMATEPFEVEGDARRHTMALIRTPWPDDPCAFLLVKHSAPDPGDRDGERIRIVGGATLALLLAAMLACYPVIRRIRFLAREVSRSADEGYGGEIRLGGRDEVAVLARAFNEAASSIRGHLAEVAAREHGLREFVANTTHDVMLPITVLQGHLAAIENALRDDRPIDHGALAGSFMEVSYMTSIINNLATSAKLEGAHLDLTRAPVDLNEIVRRVVARNTPLARIRALEIEASLPEEVATIEGDVTLLEQAIGNVVHNAVRHNHVGGHVAVILECASDRFLLRVIDDGPGVDPADIDHLCERRFRSEEARSRTPDGRGLGLHIAHDVCQRHHLDLTFRRSEYGGLEVRIAGALLTGQGEEAG
ncbi:MAG: HAMP domain-containing histidine kinase [Planctomycetes bacterium]|nr:HAMP domain-containing histidine kinase [Planctomycetota bacterium]